MAWATGLKPVMLAVPVRQTAPDAWRKKFTTSDPDALE
jgi:hypothetical protein